MVQYCKTTYIHCIYKIRTKKCEKTLKLISMEVIKLRTIKCDLSWGQGSQRMAEKDRDLDCSVFLDTLI